MFTRLFLVSVFIILFSSSVFADTASYKLGSMLHVTGDYAMEGTAFQRGVQLGVESVNAAGGISGKKLEVDLQDTRYQTKEAALLAQKFADDEDILGVIISTAHETYPSGPIFEREKLPAMVLWDAMPELEELGEYIFSIGPWAPDTGEKASRFARITKKAKKAVALCNHHDWSEAVCDAFIKDFKSAGGNVLLHEIIPPETTDYKSLLVKIRTKKPDVIYAPLVFNIPAFIKQRKALGISSHIIMADNLNEALIKTAKESFEEVYHTTVANPSGDLAINLQKLHKERFGSESELPLFTAWGYDAVMIYAEVFKRGASSREEVKKGLYSIRDLNTVNGKVAFNEKGSSPKYISVYQVQSGKLKLVEGPDK